MPRPARSKAATSVATSPKKAPARKPARRSRRTPYELVQDLRKQREALLESYGARIRKLDERIQELESRHAQRIAIQKLTETKTPEELAREEEELRARLALFRKARKAASSK